MNTYLLDIILLIPLLWGLVRGFLRGLVFELAILAAMAAGVYGSFYLSGKVAVFVTEKFNTTSIWLPFFSYLVVFLLIFVSIYFLGKSLSNVISSVGLGFMNRLLGGIFGLMKWLLVVSALVFVINKFDNNCNYIKEHMREDSKLFKPISKLSVTLYSYFEKKK